MDDFTSALDTKVTDQILKRISNSSEFKEKTFIMTTNNPKLAEFCDRLIYLENGKITFNGDRNKVKEIPHLKHLLNLKSEESKLHVNPSYPNL